MRTDRAPAFMPVWVKVAFVAVSVALLLPTATPALGLMLLTAFPVVLLFIPWAGLAMWRGGTRTHAPKGYARSVISGHSHAVDDHLDRRHAAHAH